LFPYKSWGFTCALIGKYKCVVNICLFSNFLFKVTFLTRQNNGLLVHIVTLMVQALVTCDMSEYVVSIEFWGTDNRTTLSYTSATFWNLWQPRCFFRGPKRQKSLGAKPMDEWDRSIKTAATELPSVGLCGVLVLSDFHLFSRLQKHIGGHSCQTDAEVQDAVLQWLCLQNPEFCAEGMHSLMTHCNKCLNL